MGATEDLTRLGVEIPGGWETWTPMRQSKFVLVQKRRLKKEALKRQQIAKMASRETFRGGKIHFIPADNPDPDKPTYTIRGVYGPAAGLGRSLIAVKLGNETIEHVEDWPTQRLSWGPRQFLFMLFQTAAKYGGDCELYLTHNKLEIGIDPSEFGEWVRRSNADPVRALLDTQALLEDKEHP